LDANNLQRPPISQQKNRMKNNRTMSNEKSAHLKLSDTYISKHNNQDSIEIDEDSEMTTSFNNDSNQSSNIGSLREMSVKTKENKDAYQNFSARKKNSESLI
jgi:hypothetical protein